LKETPKNNPQTNPNKNVWKKKNQGPAKQLTKPTKAHNRTTCEPCLSHA